MAGDALALVEYLDRRAGDAGIDNLADQLRWHRVIMAADLDVIIRRDARTLPFGITVSRFRQRAERRTIKRLQQIVAALAEAAHDLGVDGRDAIADRHVQLCQREEALFAQLRQHEPFDNLHRHFDFRFIARFDNPGWQHDAAVVVGQVLIAAIDTRLIARRFGDARLQIVGHQRLRHAADGR